VGIIKLFPVEIRKELLRYIRCVCGADTVVDENDTAAKRVSSLAFFHFTNLTIDIRWFGGIPNIQKTDLTDRHSHVAGFAICSSVLNTNHAAHIIMPTGLGTVLRFVQRVDEIIANNNDTTALTR